MHLLCVNSLPRIYPGNTKLLESKKSASGAAKILRFITGNVERGGGAEKVPMYVRVKPGKKAIYFRTVCINIEASKSV